MAMMGSDKLSARLKGMLLETTAVASDAPPSSRPLIEVIGSETEQGHGGGSSSSDSGKKRPTAPLAPGSKLDGDDDDCPPPIFLHGDTTTKSESSKSRNDTSSSGGVHRHNFTATANMPSLAEQMLSDATEAKRKQQRKNTQKEERRAKESTFGLKKGFLNSSSNSKKAGKRSKGSKMNGKSKSDSEKKKLDVEGQQEKESNLIYELDNDGNMIPSPSCATQLSPSSYVKGKHCAEHDPLHLPEVQSAMLSHLQSNSSQWATPDLLDSIHRDHPKLAQGMNNPRYMKELQNMQTNPKETLERLKESDPAIVDWLREFCGVMGEHFCRLGDGGGGGSVGGEEGGRAGATSTAAAHETKVREMGPLERKALRRHRQSSDEGAASAQRSKERRSDSSKFTNGPNDRRQDKSPNPNNGMDNEVASILANDELRSILLDPKMQQIMEECTNSQDGGGSKIRYYMSHEEYGPKLRMMMEAGLIRLS